MAVTAQSLKKNLSNTASEIKDHGSDLFVGVNTTRQMLGYVEAMLNTQQKSFLPKYFGYFGLIYLFRLAYNLWTLSHEIFAKKAEDNQKTFWQRIKDNAKEAFLNKERLLTIANDVVWSAINIACLIIAPELALAITIAGFGFDAAVGIYQIASTLWAKKSYKEASQKANDGLNVFLDPNPNLSLKERNTGLATNIAMDIKMSDLRKSYGDALDASYGTILKSGLKNLAINTSISVGLTLCFFMLIPGVILLTAGSALFATNLIGKTWDYFQRKIEGDGKLANNNSRLSVTNNAKLASVLASPQSDNSLKMEESAETIHPLDDTKPQRVVYHHQSAKPTLFQKTGESEVRTPANDTVDSVAAKTRTRKSH